MPLYRINYRLSNDNETYHTGGIIIAAATPQQATDDAIQWVHDHDPHADRRIDYTVAIDHVEEVEEVEEVAHGNPQQ